MQLHPAAKAETPKPEPVVFDVVPQEVLDETFKSQAVRNGGNDMYMLFEIQTARTCKD